MFIVVIALTLSALSGCAIENADADGISITHSAENNLLVQSQADEHCASFGKQALLVQRSPISSAYLVQTVTSTFRCVAPPS